MIGLAVLGGGLFSGFCLLVLLESNLAVFVLTLLAIAMSHRSDWLKSDWVLCLPFLGLKHFLILCGLQPCQLTGFLRGTQQHCVSTERV